MSYYYEDDEKKIIREDLLTSEAQKYARSFVRRINSTQLRKYFNEVRSLEAQVKAKGYPRVEPLIKMLKSKVAYGMRSGTGQRLPNEFKEFVDKAVDQIHSEEDFNAFVKHFEAVVGYFYGEGGR